MHGILFYGHTNIAMALRDQPYFPLYVQDYLTDEKLNMCSAATQGVYIKMLCVFHKSEQYGGVLLKQKDKQKSSMSENFACKLAKLLPFDEPQILSSIWELTEEGVLTIDGDFLFQKRMVNDNYLSIKRANAGKKGGLSTQNNIKDFAKAKSEANSENENEIENTNTSSLIFQPFPKIQTNPNSLTYEQTLIALETEQRWKEEMAMEFNTELSIIEKELTAWMKKQNLSGKFPCDIKDTKSHFYHTLNKKKDEKKRKGVLDGKYTQV